MASEIELAAEQVLGTGTIPRSDNLFDPISLPSGLDTRDYLRMSQQSLADTRSRQNMLSSAMQDRLKQENVFRQLEASRLEQSALQELNALDSSDPDFQEEAEMFTELAAYSPAVSRALAAKQARYTQESAALNNISDDLSKIRASDEEIGATINHAKLLLGSRGPNSASYLKFRAGLARNASQKAYDEQVQLRELSKNTEGYRLKEAKDFQSKNATFREETMKKLTPLSGDLPREWDSLLSIAFPEEPEVEKVTLTGDNVDQYDLSGFEPEEANDIRETARISGYQGEFKRRPPNPALKLVQSDRYGLPEELQEIALNKRNNSLKSFVNATEFNDYIFPEKPEKEDIESNRYWKPPERGSKRKELELTEEGERYQQSREANLESLHKDLQTIRDLPIDIRKFYNSSPLASAEAKRQLLERMQGSDATETSSGIQVQDNTPKINAFLDRHLD